jgi:AcrR family transcriptional regulator
MGYDQAVKERILSLMRDRLLQLGFSKVTLDEIATELGMSKKTLYKYFAGKDELALEAIRFHFGGIESEMNEIVSSAQPFTEKLHAIMMMQRRQINKLDSLVMEDIRKHAPQIWKEIETLRRERLLSKIEQMFAVARDEHVFRPNVDERVVLMMILACVDAIVNPETVLSLNLSMKDAVYSVFHVIFEGALTEEARAKMVHIGAAHAAASPQ